MKQLICDFCGAPDPQFSFRAGPSITVAETELNAVVCEDIGDGWAACEICFGAINRNDRGALIRRSVRIFYEKHQEFSDVPIETITKLIETQHANFFNTKLDNGRKGLAS